MGSKLGGSDDDAIVDINITPFVDIVLVVLIIFMVTATYIVKQSIKVELPEAATGEATETTSLGLNIDKNGQLSMDGEPMTEDGLREAIRAEQTRVKAEGGDIICLIAADKVVPHGTVVGLIDLIRQEGVAKFALNIEPTSLPAEASGAVVPPIGSQPSAP